MAVSNREIVFGEQARLFEEGIIGLDEDGMFEPLLTYAEWKKRGFQVRKGERAIAKFGIWKPKTRKQKEEDEQSTKSVKTNGFFLKTSAFFIRRQVEPINADHPSETTNLRPTRVFMCDPDDTWDTMEDYM